MPESAVVRARNDEKAKNEADRLLMVRVAKEKALPFEPPTPNATTIRAMKEARKGKLASFKSVEALMADLNAAAP